jgi:Glycosyltransferase like family 2
MPKNRGPLRDDYTLVVTSCCRLDLLERTLRSFYSHVDVAPKELIVVEDSAEEQVRDVVDALGVPAQTIVRGARIGQVQAIDHAYAKVTTPLIFHCEDDWLFTRGGFIAESAVVLQAREDFSMVGLRPRAELNPLVRRSPVQWLGEVAYLEMDPKLHPEHFGYSFNPGLRRLSDYHRIGPYALLGEEADVSYAFKKAGYRTANLEVPAVEHIGYGRHIDDPNFSPRARGLLGRLAKSARKRLKRLGRLIDN